jgi:competence ComEA-like helix-hairpin-helix protein
MKARIKNYLSLTKKEWNGMVVMLIVIALVLAAPYVFQWLRKDTTINVSAFNAAVAQLNKANPGYADHSGSKAATITLFKFNPNHLPAEKWTALGLNDKQISTIKNYEAKGGKFYNEADVKKMYSITDADYERLAPYISLPKKSSVKKPVIELNTADSAALTAVSGIGPAFATRIIYYRERLGGFITKEQLKEVFGMDELKYKEISSQLRVNSKRIRKININTITFDKLRLMPYLNYKQVNAIIEYRKQHGDYTAMADLQNIAILDAVILRKIEPYLVFR